MRQNILQAEGVLLHVLSFDLAVDPASDYTRRCYLSLLEGEGRRVGGREDRVVELEPAHRRKGGREEGMEGGSQGGVERLAFTRHNQTSNAWSGMDGLVAHAGR